MAEMYSTEDGLDKEQEVKPIVNDDEILNKEQDQQCSDNTQEGDKGSNSIIDNKNVNLDEAPPNESEEVAVIESPENIEDQDLSNTATSALTKRKERSHQMQLTMSRLEQCQFLDIQDPSTSQMIITILSKNIKDAQEIALIKKFVRQLSVFQQKEELFDSASLSNRIIQSLRSVFVPKHKALFKYGDRGNEYFIMLSGQAFCLVPYTNMIPQDQINKQIDERLNTQNTQTSEEELDEDFLLKNYSRCQCVKIYQPGEAFGEIALLTTESKRMASIVCKYDSWFISLDREAYNSIQGSYQQHLLNEKVHFLKSFSMFEPIVVNKMLSFLHEMKEQSFERGQFIYQEKKNPLKNEKIKNKVYFLINGDIDLVTYNYHNNNTNNNLDGTLQPMMKHFRNTKVKLKEKVIVSLSGGSYFGDEEINGSKMKVAAVCRSQTCKLLSVDSVKLLQFLTVYETDNLFLNMAITKQECLTELLQGDILQQNNLKVNEMYSEMYQKRQQKVMQVITEQKINGIKKDMIEDIEGTGGKKQLQKKKSMKKKNDLNDEKEDRSLQRKQSNFIETKGNSEQLDKTDKHNGEQDTNITLPKDPSTMIEFPRMSKFKNVYQLGQSIPKANEIKLQKTNWELNDSSCKFNLEDVPMTTTMNRDQAVLDRLHVRLSKIYPSLSSDSNNLKMPSIMQHQSISISRHNSSIFKSTNVSTVNSPKDTQNLNISEIPIIPPIQLSNSQNCFSQTPNSHHKMSHSVFLPPLRLAEINDSSTSRNNNNNIINSFLKQRISTTTSMNISNVIMNQSHTLTNSQLFSLSPIQSPKVTRSNFHTQLPSKQKPSLSHQNSVQFQQEQQLNSKRSQISSSQYQEQIFNKLLAANNGGKSNYMRVSSIH